MPAILYQAVNSVNGKRYIGISQCTMRQREQQHRRYARWKDKGAAIGRAIRKYGDKIVFSVLAVCPDWEYAKQAEIKAIEVYRPEYNLTKGGDGIAGFSHSAITRAKMARAALGREHTAEAKAKMAKAKRGKPLSPEHRLALSRSHPRRAISAEQKAKISRANSGRTRTADTRAKMAAAWTPERKAKHREFMIRARASGAWGSRSKEA